MYKDITKKEFLDVGLIGFGGIGKFHAEVYDKLLKEDSISPKPRIKAILRKNISQDKKLIEKFGAPLVTNSEAEFFNQNLDLVDICSPNNMHLSQIKKTVENNVKVIYCEKPLGLDLQEAKDIEDLANSIHAITQTGFIFRYFPALQQMRQKIIRGQIGEPFHFFLRMYKGSYLDENRPYSWRLNKASAGGGALTDLGIHLIDLLRFLMGNVDWIQCKTKTCISERKSVSDSSIIKVVDVDDWALCTIGMENGACGSLEVSRVAGGKEGDVKIEVFGSKGSVEASFLDPGHANYYNQDSSKSQACTSRFGSSIVDSLMRTAKDIDDYFFAAHLESIYNILNCIKENKESDISFNSGLKAQEVLEAAYFSDEHNGKRVFLPFDL
ncbi:Gfo/Idh/MocA family oxidoreductase [Patescibacteria group bacterium]|nr:Gfo/Idh/MocA family oxidoreductase [Patescibacteria group bacterium]